MQLQIFVTISADIHLLIKVFLGVAASLLLAVLVGWLARGPVVDAGSSRPVTPGATDSTPAVPPPPAASALAGSALAVPGFASTSTDCAQLNAAHARMASRCSEKPATCIDDGLRAEGFDPRALDLCRMFRPGKEPLQ